MGKRDYKQREQKKAKKDAKKIPPVTIVTTPVEVEVIKRGKKKRDEDEEG